MQYPDFSDFPNVHNTRVDRLELSSIEAEEWSRSSLVAYGANAHVRCTHTGRFPVVKLAMPDQSSRDCLSYEFGITKQMKQLGLPVVEVGPEPLRDAQGVFGYRMEALCKHPYSDRGPYAEEVRAAMECLHKAGFTHGDLSPSNVMRTRGGQLVLIDISYSGTLGTAIPDNIPSWVYQSAVFHTAADQNFLDRDFSTS